MSVLLSAVNDISQGSWYQISENLIGDETNPWQILFPLLILSIGITFVVLLNQKKLEQSNQFKFDLYRFGSFKTETEKKLEAMNFFRKNKFSGRSLIFINKDKPSELIKWKNGCSISDFEIRLKNMQIFQEFCKSQDFKFLVVPKATIEDCYLREERLPISSLSQMEQIGLYTSNLEAFTNAIEEFVKFLCLVEFHDLLGGKNLLSSFSEILNARYDNAPLYLENGEGKIGLVDLEGFYLKNCTTTPSIEHIKSVCVTSITFFPFHFDLILKIAESFDVKIKNEVDELFKIKTKAINFFEKTWIAHKKFLDANGITPQNPTQMVQMTANIKFEIINSLIEKLYEPLGELSEEPSLLAAEYFFSPGMNKDTMTMLTSQILPAVLNHVELFNQKRFNYLITQKVNKKAPSPYKLSRLRTVLINRNDIPFGARGTYDSNEKLLTKIVEEEILILKSLGNYDNLSLSCFAEWITDSIYHLLVEKNVIAGFKSRIYGGNDIVLF